MSKRLILCLLFAAAMLMTVFGDSSDVQDEEYVEYYEYDEIKEDEGEVRERNVDFGDYAAYIGIGIGLGFVSNLFVCTVLYMLPGWKSLFEVLKRNQSGRGLCAVNVISGLFITPPFVLMPVILCLSFWNFVIPVIGYGLPFIVFLLKRKGLICNSSTDEINVEIFQWLQNIALLRYYSLFKEQGYKSMADLATITAHDLQDLGITEQIHADLMLRSIRQIVQSVEVGSPLGSARKINSKQLWGPDGSTNMYRDENEPLPLNVSEV